jgi:hypothetical protein
LPPVVSSCSVMLANVMKTDVVCPDGQAKVPGSAGEALSVTWPVILPLWSTWKVPLPEAGGPGIVVLLEAFGLFPPPLTQKYVVVIELAVAVTTSESPTFPSPDSVKLTVRTALKVVEVAVAPLSAAALEAPDEVAAAVVDVLNVAELVTRLNLPTDANATPAARSTAKRQTMRTVFRRKPQNNEPSPFRSFRSRKAHWPIGVKGAHTPVLGCPHRP